MATPHTEVESEIMRYVRELDDAIEQLEARSKIASEKEVDFKVAWANAMLNASGTVAKKEAQATLATHEAMRARKIADALRDVAAEKCRTLRAQLSAVQSLNANYRSMV